MSDTEEIEDSEEYVPKPKQKPIFFSTGNNLHSQNLSGSEVDGFSLRKEYEEKVQSMLSKAVNSILLDIKRNPPKRR